MSNQQDTKPLRPVRSFVRREGRLTAKQQWALTHMWPLYGVESPGPEQSPFDFCQLFGNNCPVVVEIGFGDGNSLLAMAANNPNQNYLGIEVYRNGVGAILAGIHEQGLHNLKVMVGDAVEIFQQHIPPQSLQGVQLYFPDPWPKKRHHKRRIVQPAFIETVARRLTSGGRLHLATDWEPYALHMLEVLDEAPMIKNSVSEGFAPRPQFRPLTKFEKRGQRLGHGVWDLIFYRL